MNLTMSNQESAYLQEVLGSCLKEMHSEIVHTDNFDLKTHLKSKRDSLQDILSRLHIAEDLVRSKGKSQPGAISRKS